jgi:putative oxidoreductase
MIEVFGKCVIQANKAATWLQHPLLLAIRLYWGWSLMLSGWGKFQDIGRVVRWFDELGIPFPTEGALAVSSIEFFGSMLFMIGLLARPVGGAIALVMMGAYATSDSAVLGTVTRDFFCFDGAQLGDCITLAQPFPYWFAGMIILTCGAGQFSIDAEIARWWAKANKSS